MKVRAEVVRGRPIRVEGRELVPVVRRTVATFQRATIGRGVSGRVGGLVRLRPVGIVERREAEERLLPIPDRTREVLWGMAAVAALVWLLCTVAVRLARQRGEEG